ncbi:hypothetical protein T484DRAFT_3440799 [Baffinella frigidus]|nr:hypothetical protein T484DRAFT_3440799 [Cryptophyta sp. CCMP2293]
MVATVPLDGSGPERTGSGASRPVIGGVRAQIFKQRPGQGDLMGTVELMKQLNFSSCSPSLFSARSASPSDTTASGIILLTKFPPRVVPYSKSPHRAVRRRAPPLDFFSEQKAPSLQSRGGGSASVVAARTTSAPPGLWGESCGVFSQKNFSGSGEKSGDSPTQSGADYAWDLPSAPRGGSKAKNFQWGAEFHREDLKDQPSEKATNALWGSEFHQPSEVSQIGRSQSLSSPGW